jgi:Lipid A core - O-antigen ligase and related enzymes
MSKKQTNYSKNKKNVKKVVNDNAWYKSNLFLIPVFIVLGVIPLIVRYYKYNTGLSKFNWFSTEDANIDFFLYYKHLFFIAICGIMLILLVYSFLYLKKKLKFTIVLIPLLVYVALALLSTLLSKYSSYGYKGIFEQFESIFVILGYCIVVVYCFQFINTEEDVKAVLKFFLYSVLVLGILGVFQCIGHDLFSSDFGRKLITPRQMWDAVGNFQFNFGKFCSYLTLYNPNYVGVYVAMVTPVFTCLLITTKGIKVRGYYLAAIVGMLFSLYGSKSDAGFIALFASIIVILIFLRKYIFKNYKIVISVIIVGLVLTTGLCLIKKDYITNKFNAFFNSSAGISINKIQTGKQLIITYKGNDMIINFNENSTGGLDFNIKDSKDQEINMTYNSDSNSIEFLDKRFQNITISTTSYSGNTCAVFHIDNKDWIFLKNSSDGTYYYVNRFGRLDNIVTSESALFTGHETLASGRGYLWSRTIPLLKKYLILGSGADTFVLVFPQQDYVNLYNYGFGDQLVTKPHSLYLQIGVQSGVLSLIAFLMFYVLYFISSIRLYIDGRYDNIFKRVGIGIFIGTFAYMFTGLTNDSCVAVSPVFWGLIGFGIAVNYKVKEVNSNNQVKQGRI